TTVVTPVPFIRTVGSVICRFQLRKIDILTRNVLTGWIVRCPKRQGIARIGNHLACHGYYDAIGIRLDEDRVIWTRNPTLFFFHVLFFLLELLRFLGRLCRTGGPQLGNEEHQPLPPAERS